MLYQKSKFGKETLHDKRIKRGRSCRTRLTTRTVFRSYNEKGKEVI
jgi:hypothetical protein